MEMRERWACPDLGIVKPEGMFQPVPGSEFEFNDCPAYYLRTSAMRLPAEHLIDGVTHPATIISELAFEIESGARNVDTVSPKARELVHIHLRESRLRDRYAEEIRRKKAGN